MRSRCGRSRSQSISRWSGRCSRRWGRRTPRSSASSPSGRGLGRGPRRSVGSAGCGLDGLGVGACHYYPSNLHLGVLHSFVFCHRIVVVVAVTGVVASDCPLSASINSFESAKVLEQADYQVLDLAFGMTLNDTDIEFFVRNLTDERANLYYNDQDDIPRITTNRPRNVGIRLSYKF